jgi:hypothetical protein
VPPGGVRVLALDEAESPDKTSGWAGLGMVRIEHTGITFLSSAR